MANASKTSPSTSPTPFPELNALLRELVKGVQDILDDDFVAACLQGSFAIGDFDKDSDVDFIIAVRDELSDQQLQGLQVLHAQIYDLDSHWAKHLEGSYFPKKVLRHHSHSGKKLWYLDHGARSLVRSDHCNTVVVRWTVREHGVPLAGPSPASLVDPIPVELLRREILSTMRDWGQEILADPEQINNCFYQGFAVLSYCRMLRDVHAGGTGSKRAGADWARANLNPSWAGLIDRAWAGRPNPAVSVRQPADPEELRRTLTFIQYALAVSKQIAAALGIRME